MLGIVVLTLAGAAAAGYVWWRDAEEAREAAESRQRRREERERADADRRAEALEDLREESSELIPEVLGDLALGMKKDELRAARPGASPRLDPAANDPLRLTYLEERLPNGSQVVYGFDAQDHLSQIQILSVLPSAEALEAHMTAMIETYGRPSGIWDCPDTGGVPTRRFTWRRAETALADILLVYGNRISQTLYIGPQGMIGASLQRAQCRPLRSVEELGNFPATTVEAIERAQKQGSR